MAQPKKRPFVSLKGMETGRVTSAGKPVYKYKGEEISEKSIDIEADGKTYVIPTVIDGKLYTEEAAVAKFFNKEVEPIKVLKENIKERSKKLSKGGDMNKQMELFEDGGLKEEGGMVDEVSGNDVPVGSTREEVRDDIPAQLSEGEFVFPADVVRYLGLEKLMKLRQEAKQGLKQMEAMGQMGNSEEATMPDDLPFDETDLDVEDVEDEEDIPFDESDLDMEDDLEYNIGGYVPPDISPFDVKNRKVDPIFSIPTIPIAGAPKPVTKTQSDFDKLLDPAGSNLINTNNPSLVPQAKMVRYFNKDTNQVRMIPHLTNPDGSQAESLYPIPTGFVPSEEQPKKFARTTSVVPSSFEVQENEGPGQGPGDTAVDPAGDPLGYQSMFSLDELDTDMKNIGNMQKSLLGLTKKGMTGTILGNVFKGITGKPNMDKITLGVITNAYTKAKKDLGVLGKNVVNLDEITRNKLSKSVRRAIKTVRSVATRNGKSLPTNEIIKNVNVLAKIYGLKPITAQKKRNWNLHKNIYGKLNDIEREREKIRGKIIRRGLLNPQQGFTNEEDMGIESMSIEDQQSIMDSISQGKGVNEYGGVSKDTFSDIQDITSQPQYGFDTVSVDGGFSDDDAAETGMGVGDEDAIAKGSLITKRKASGKLKKKYMKRGGLASKK